MCYENRGFHEYCELWLPLLLSLAFSFFLSLYIVSLNKKKTYATTLIDFTNSLLSIYGNLEMDVRGGNCVGALQSNKFTKVIDI